MLTPAPAPRQPAPRAHVRARRAYLRGWARGWSIPERLSVWQWADKHRVLVKDTSKEPGRWRTERNPPARAIMESLSPHSGAEIVTVVAGVQTVKTESLNNLVAYVIDHDPGPLIICQPTQELGNAWKLMRFDPLVETTPSIAAKINTTKRRESSNTLARVKFPGGWLIVSHAASASSLGMYSARYVLADEVDSYEELKGGEGDPLMTLRRRADSFGRTRKIYQCSSPKKLMGASLIWREYLAGDQRELYVPCPHCDHRQILHIDNVLPTGEYLCEACGTPIPHSAKTDMLARGEWRAKFPERTHHHSYRLPSLYTPLGLGRTWLELHQERATAESDPALMKAFVSTSLAIPYESSATVTQDDVKALAEDWAQRHPPKACLLLVASTDCQANRLETLILGIGRGATPKSPQLYVVDYVVTNGSPVDPDTWDDLEAYLGEPIVNPYGQTLPIRLHAVDSGNWANEVYLACHARRALGWVPVKGSSTRTAPLIGPPKPHDLNWRGQAVKNGGAHHMIGTDHAKDTLLDRLAAATTQTRAERWWHLPCDLPDAWYAGIVAEQRDPETGRWYKTTTSARNEPVDTAVYAWAIAHLSGTPRLGGGRIVKLQHMTQRDWEQLEAAMCPVQIDLFADPAATPSPAPAAAPLAPSIPSATPTQPARTPSRWSPPSRPAKPGAQFIID